LKRGFVFSRRRDRLIALLFVVVLILSTSSVAYVGLAILGLTYVVYSVRTGRFSKRKAIAVFVPVGILATAIVAVAIISVPFVSQIADSVLLSKASSGSAIERAMTISYAFGYFQKYPILGIGWGSATSHDVIVKLLSNVGIVGTVVFFWGIFSIVRSNWRRISRGNSPLELSREAWLMSLVSFVLTSVLIEFPLPFGNFWLIIGMSMATAATARGLPVAARARPAVANAPLRTEP
jgi:O-antigen ligase